MRNLSIATREYREKLLSDPYRPVFHFAFPDDNGLPGDSNGAFFVDGVYHLMYLYRNSKTNGYHWGHISSVDLLHWRHHPDALVCEDGDEGCYSGGAFVDDDKTAYLTFWKFPSVKEGGDHGGIAIAYSKPPYDKWERMKSLAVENGETEWGVTEIEINGKTEHICGADPSNIWKADGWYYFQAGNFPILNRYGRDAKEDKYYNVFRECEESNPHYTGDWTDLFRSKDLKNWEYLHRFYINDHSNSEWPDITEDDMCPSFLPLFDAEENGKFTNKYLQLFIAHIRGCQYYIGRLENETFIPETHGRMSWKDIAYFAPEALIDSKNRHIIFTWLRDNLDNDFEKYGWSGVFGFPRNVWLESGELRMAPIKELDDLQYNCQEPKISENDDIIINNPTVFRLKAEIDMHLQERAGFSVRCDDESREHTDIYYDKENKKLVFDASQGGIGSFAIKEEAPFELEENENLILDVFVDKSVIEVYANKKQAICRRVFQSNPLKATGLKLLGDREKVLKLNAYDIAPTNPY